MNKGFTLIELLVVMSIVVILTALTLPNYRFGDRQLSLQRSVYKLAQDLRRAQEMSVSAVFSAQTDDKIPAGGYGIQLKTELEDREKYILFGDKNNDHQYKKEDDYLIEETTMEKGVIIKNPIQTKRGNEDDINVTFVAPDPDVFLVSDKKEADWARITLSLEQDSSQTKTIYINKAGLIAVE